MIPNYNEQGVIERAVSSALTQSHKHIEVIVVDDCSTDNSVSVLKRRFDDPRLQVKQHDENRMIGAARNTGISAAQGAYLFFLDSDDFLLHNALRDLLSCAKDSNADVVQGATQRLSADGNTSIFHQCQFGSMGGVDGLKLFSNTQFASFAWNKLYKKILFEGNSSIRFTENYMHEDVPFAMACAFKARGIASIATPVICYVENHQSVTRKTSTRLNVESYAALYLKIADLCHSFDLYSSKAGLQLARDIFMVQGNGDIIPKLLRCREQMGASEFEETLSDVGLSMGGAYGMAAASLIGALATALHDQRHKSKDPFRSIKRFVKKRLSRTP